MVVFFDCLQGISTKLRGEIKEGSPTYLGRACRTFWASQTPMFRNANVLNKDEESPTLAVMLGQGSVCRYMCVINAFGVASRIAT